MNTADAGAGDRAALDFLAAYLAERAAGRDPPLATWLQRWPAHEARVAAEWCALRGGTEPSAAAPAAAADPAVPDGVPTGYRVLRELGRGGQGVVYLAEDLRLHRQVALKVLHRGLAAFAGPAALRFERELAAIGRLDHPCLCAVHAAGSGPDGSWIAMKFVDGPSLQQRIAAARADGSGAPRTRAAIDAIAHDLERLAEGLQVAHAAGLVHRDIKPGNVLIGADGTPVLVDFGLARQATAAEADPAAAAVTLPGAVVGTPSYLAPELLRDAPADARSDVWALGACLFELLTLERPFAAATVAAELRLRATAAVPDVRSRNPAVPRDLAVVVATALAVEPGQRYASAADFAADLRRYRTLQPLLARPAGPLLVLRRWLQRNPALGTALALLLVVLLAGLTVSLVLLRDTQNALADVRRLSDLKLTAELQTRADGLWPLREDRLAGPGGMDAWLRDADEVLGRRALHERALARATAAQAAGTADTAAPWQVEQLQNLLVALDGLSARRARIAANRTFASEVRRRTLDDLADAWRTTIAAIAASPHYGGLHITPQLGLVPLGPDPASGLFEFAHLQSGKVPERDPATGRLSIGPETGIVLVLLPGGTPLLGAETVAPADGHPANLDAGAQPGEGPCYRPHLLPFFLAKYEVTQGQWQRHTGSNPSNYASDSDMKGPKVTLANPVEQIDWYTVDRTVREMSLTLPTEAQWEYAYRAGAATAFPFGDDIHGLQDRENLADADALRLTEGNTTWPCEKWLHDGNTVHAAVGSFLPNAFGIHDLGGNVKEWCADSWEDYAEVPPREGDGYRTGRFDKYRVVRGGGFSSAAKLARCAFRSGYPAKVTPAENGVRAARALDP